ncbi:MAG: DUF99 family protein [Candidatus Bathyarchaeia archaeon]
MPIHVHKKGIRALGVSESFVKGVSERSFLAGVVMRADMVLDGFSFSTARVGGMDTTQKIIEMYEALEREDINLMLLNGCVISWYNVIDLHRLVEATGLPLICVTYEDSEGLERYFEELFPQDWRSRVEVYHKNGPRTPMRLHTGHIIYARFLDMSQEEAMGALNKFTLHGAVPEPLRIARLLARSLIKSTLFGL